MEEYQDPQKITEAMKGGLARMFADIDFRDYLQHMLTVYNHNTLVAVRANKPEVAKDYTAKLDSIKKLLDNGKAMFLQAEKLKVTTLEELESKQDAIQK